MSFTIVLLFKKYIIASPPAQKKNTLKLTLHTIGILLFTITHRYQKGRYKTSNINT